MANLEEFREQTRAWLEENCPASMREPINSDKDQCWGGRNWVFASEEQRLWLERMAEKGWTAPQWPAEHGGGGLAREEAKVLQQEMARIRARRPLESFGIDMLGPALLKFASEEQKQRFIPEITQGDKRILVIDGEPVPYALARIPREGETRGNLAAGGSGQGVALSARDRWIVSRVGPALRARGIVFAGLDVIGDYLTEINVTSPTCIRELDALYGLDIAGQLLESIEGKLNVG